MVAYEDKQKSLLLLLGEVAVDEAAVVGEVIGEQGTEAFDVVAPVAVEFARYAEPGHQLSTGGLHAKPGGITGGLVKGAGGVGHDEDFVAFFQGGEGGEGDADFGDDARDEELFLTGGFDGLHEVRVVPGIDVTGAGDVRGIGKEFLEFRNEGAVGAVFKAGGQDGGELEVFGSIGQREDVVLEVIRREIMDEVGEAGLMIHEQDGDIVFIEAVVFEVAHKAIGSGVVRRK